MPLLRKKAFKKNTATEFLRDNERVFHCDITDEIFRDYQEFVDRIFLCNSQVWTCYMTGKSNLTYLEAQESEDQARKLLEGFAQDLKVPILYIASLTKRTSFGDMADDVFLYTKDRYFVGENIEACLTGNKWKDCHIISVIAPDYKHETLTNGNKTSPEKHLFIPPANLYKYEIEHLNASDSDLTEIMIVDSTHIRRKKSKYSREKSKLFLKQHVDQDDRGVFTIKAQSLEQYNIKDVMWETIFDGPKPNFQTSKRFEKAVNGKPKKQKQESMAKYLQKNGKKDVNKEKKSGLLLEQMKKREEDFKKQKQLNEEQKALQKQKKKEDSLKLAQYFKDWTKPKEDLELEDQMKLPIPTPVNCKVPTQYFGVMLCILEFVHNFHKLLSTKNFFPGGFTLESLERALTEREVAGPLTDLIQMLLGAIFNCQEEESNSYNTGTETVKDIDEEKVSTAPNLQEGTHLATLASKWPVKYQGLPISRLPMYSLTVSEILRMHLLSSGARIKDSGAKWRYAQRGGYSSEDDPGLHLRLHQAHILKSLALHNVVELPISDKIEIISCLMNQIVTYVDVRDVVEENLEKIKQSKIELKVLKGLERKRELELVTQKSKLKKEMAEDQEGLKIALEKLDLANDKKHSENQRKIEKLTKATREGQKLLGRDRAYRKYLKIESVPGLFVSWEDELSGTCLDNVIVQYPNLVNASRPELMAHIKNYYENKNFKKTSPVKSPKNGTRKSLPDTSSCNELLLCTADPTNCPVHNVNFKPKQTWSFFHEKEQLEQLINSLNKRGIRESELRETLTSDEDGLTSLIAKTPVSILNPDIVVKQEEAEENRPLRKKKDKYEEANLGYPSEMSSEEVLESALIENILELEEKINSGGLGALEFKDREKWRSCLHTRNYDEFETLQIEKTNKHLKVKTSDKDHSRSNTPEIPEKKEDKEYHDPGRYLGATLESTDNKSPVVQQETVQRAIKCLATALWHVADGVEYKYMKRPLGHADVRPSNKHKEPHDVLEKWQQSLLAATSFSQVFLHYGTLDSCVMWSRSALLARCQVCRRQRDSENMLLCDSCNLGHHLYCLKPKLTVIPQGDWFCDKCKKQKEKEEQLLSPEPEKKRRRIFVEVEEEADEEEEQDIEDEEVGEEEEISDSEKGNEEEYEDNNIIEEQQCKTCGSGGEMIKCEKCDFSFHKECVAPPLRRLPRGPWSCPSCSGKGKNGYSGSDNSDNEVIIKRPMRRDESKDLPLHNAALQELLSDIMRYEAAWPFLRPVQQKEVPDYYDIIKEPMDFGTIKYKLNMGKYSTDSQLMRDVVLVFNNCNTYNSSSDEVYKCGYKLLSYLAKKAYELGLEVPEELMLDNPEPKAKRPRVN
ncbi:unnamed protein product [Ceutorhynchus assimilis]|uniref:Bromodomain adjacent to zinc finger domain protein 1A n=1 Tax=Ceutorhynchus assimilis TaxID=467358 RepID=A0A9P0GRJ1_9CUCU|nr:unnamed protein product [Ceutorhynchus assimilis]